MAKAPQKSPAHTTADQTTSAPQQTLPEYKKKGSGRSPNDALPKVKIGLAQREVPNVEKPSRVRTANPAYYGREPGTEQLYPAGSIIPDFVGPLGKGMTILGAAKADATDDDED